MARLFPEDEGPATVINFIIYSCMTISNISLGVANGF